MKIAQNFSNKSASSISKAFEEENSAKTGSSNEIRYELNVRTRLCALNGLRKSPLGVTSSSSRSRASCHASAAGTDGKLQKKADIYTDKKIFSWIDVKFSNSRLNHKIQAMLRMRDAHSRARAFIEFMTDDKGNSDATALDLGDGWTRVTRLINGKTTLIDVQCDSDGQVVDARHPGKFPYLPKEKERDAYNTVLHEMKLRATQILSKVPVYYVNRNTRGYLIPTHGYVVAGHPNRGRKSGAILYGVGGDPKRGPVVLDKKLITHLTGKRYSKKPCEFSAEVRTAILALSGASFATREDFYEAYSRVRGGETSLLDLHDEINAIYHRLPFSTMEMWPKKSGDYRVESPSAPERDLRAFEKFPKEIGRKVWLKKISDVDSLDLLEARQQFTLHQLYQDEVLGRNGTGVPLQNPEVNVDFPRRNLLLASTPRFQRLPPHKTDKVGNCNTGASSLLQRAVDRYSDKNNLPPKKVAAASFFGIGSTHRLAIWDPLRADSKKRL